MKTEEELKRLHAILKQDCDCPACRPRTLVATLRAEKGADMTTPIQADALAALEILVSDYTTNDIQPINKLQNIIRTYIEQNSPATSDAAIGSGTNAVLRLQDGQESAPDRGDIIKGRTVDVEALKRECERQAGLDDNSISRNEARWIKDGINGTIKYLAAQGLLNSADKIILNREELEGMKKSVSKYDSDYSQGCDTGWNDCIAALIAKAKGE